MSYTSEELIEIAENIEAFRLESYTNKLISHTQDEQLYLMIKDLYKLSHGIHTKEVEKEYISHYNSSS